MMDIIKLVVLPALIEQDPSGWQPSAICPGGRWTRGLVRASGWADYKLGPRPRLQSAGQDSNHSGLRISCANGVSAEGLLNQGGN